MIRIFLSASLALAAGLGAGPSVAQAQSLRHAVVLDERLVVEGAAGQIDRTAVSTALSEALLEQGVTLIDADQSRALRQSVDPQALLDGQQLGPVTASDADVLVVGVVLGSITRPLDLNVFGCHLNAQIRVIAVDSGEVLAAFSETVVDRDFTVEQAAFQASRKLGAQMAERVAATTRQPAERRIELHVTTDQPVGIEVTERLLRLTEQLAGVKSARVLNVQGEEARLEVVLSGRDARDLALELSQRPRAGLFVWGYSERIIRAKLKLGDALSLRLVPTRFTAQGAGARRADHQATILPRALAAALSADGLFALDPSVDLPPAPSSRARAAMLKRMAQSSDEGVLLLGSHAAAGDRVAVSASLVRARGQRVLARGSADCDPSALTACMEELAGRLREPTVVALQSSVRPDLAAEGRDLPLRVGQISLTDLFPARSAGATALRDGQGDAASATEWVELTNRSEEPVTDVEVSVTIPGFTSGESVSTVERLEPGETRKIALGVALDRERLRTHDQNLTTLARVAIRYRAGEFAIRDDVQTPVTIYHRNAMSWSDPRFVSSFVTATTDAVQTVARRTTQALSAEARRDALAVPVALFEQLRSLAYVADPVNPYAADTVDYVQFPVQTLSRGAGDCDDLAVLYVALSEAVGQHTLLITTPGHIFVAVPTRRPAHSLQAGIRTPDSRLMEYDGRLWLPLETSALDKSFDEAWAFGSKLVADATRSRKLGIIDVRAAWATYPPVDLSPAEDAAARPVVELGEDLEVTLGQAQEGFQRELGKMLAFLDEDVSEHPSDAELLNRKGVALVAMGRLPDARAVFRQSVDLGSDLPGPSNNLGNLLLLDGDSAEALHWYDRALQQSASDAEMRRRIVLNRLLAAWMLDPAGSRFLELVLSAEDADLQAFYQGVNGGPLRGSASLEDLKSRPAGSVPVQTLVHWL